MEQVWNGYGTDTQLNITFHVLHSMVWNGGVWNGIRGLDPELWIGVWIGMCARPCSGPFILSGSHINNGDDNCCSRNACSMKKRPNNNNKDNNISNNYRRH